MTSLRSLFNMGKHPVVRSVGLYTFTNFLSKSVSFLLVFIFTDPRYITPAENGMLSLFNNTVIFLKPVLMMGIIHSASVDFFKMPRTEFRNSFTTGFLLSAAACLFSWILFIVFEQTFSRELGFTFMVVFLIPAITFFTFCFDQLQNILRNEHKAGLFMKTGVAKLLIEVILSVALVVFFNWRWYGRMAGIAASHFILALFGVIYFVRQGYLFGKVRKEYIRSELAYAGPVIALQMAFFAVSSSDKFLLSYFSNDDNATVGVYSIASIFASVVFTLHHALIQYVFPKIFSKLAEAQVDYRSVKKHFGFYVLAMAAATVILMAGTPLIYRYFINPLYHSALEYLHFFYVGYFLWSVAYFFFSFLLFRKEKGKILFLSLFAILISLGLNYALISRWEAYGGAVSVAVSCLFILLLTIAATLRDIRLMFKSH